MFIWISLAVVAQFLNAGVALVDKYIVTHDELVPKPFVYAFYSALLAGMWVFVFAFGLLPIPLLQKFGFPTFAHVHVPNLVVIALAMLAAYTFFAGLVSLYTALRDADASDVVPVVGAISAIGSFFLGYLFLGTRLTPNFILGIVLLSLGTFLVSHLRFRWQTALVSIHAGLFFAAHFVALKGLFNITNFDNGFFWSRISFIVVALSMLLVPGHLMRIQGHAKTGNARKGSVLVLANKFVAGIASILILKATALGSVSVVQALSGLQFVFILFFTLFLGNKTPTEYGENVTRPHDLYHKTAFVAIITLGFFVLFV